MAYSGARRILIPRGWRLQAIGVILVVLGVVMPVLGVVSLLETRWVVDPLVYRDVQYFRGYRMDWIHLVAEGGQIYRLPKRLWPAGMEGPDLVERLRQDSVGTARVAGGDSQFWFGYPTIEYLRTSTLTLDGPPPGRWRSLLSLVLGPVLIVSGFTIVRRTRRPA